MKTTTRQSEIIDAIKALRVARPTVWPDIDQIMRALGYVPTKQAMQCSLRFLERKGLIARKYEVRRERRRRIIELR